MPLSYTEPELNELLILLGFVALLQLGRKIAATLVGAGLLGECAVGIIFGPVAGILPVAWEEFGLALGYLGLCLILLEGGLALKPQVFLSNLPLGVVSAIVGIGLPMGFTFALFSAFGLPRNSAFAAGSSLCSTSLGTTFYILDSVSKTQGIDLAHTQVGSILESAALVDDVIALALLAVLTSLGEDGGGGGSGLAWIVVRPLVSSAVIASIAPLAAVYLFRPVWRRCTEPRLERWTDANRDLATLSIGVLVLAAFLTM